MHFDLGQDPAIQSSVPTPFLCSLFFSCVFPGWASLCPGLHSFLCAPTFASFNSLLDLLITFLFFHHLLLEQATGEPDQNAIGNGTLHISEGKGNVGKLSDTNNHISEHLSWQESHEDSRMTANLPEMNDADEGDEDEE